MCPLPDCWMSESNSRLVFVATHIVHLQSPIFWGESKLAPHERYSFNGLFSRRCSPIRCLLFDTMILPSKRWTDYQCIWYHRYWEWHCCYISRAPHPPASVFSPAFHKPHDPQHHCFWGTPWYCCRITHKIQLSFFLWFCSDTESHNLCTMHSYWCLWFGDNETPHLLVLKISITLRSMSSFS